VKDLAPKGRQDLFSPLFTVLSTPPTTLLKIGVQAQNFVVVLLAQKHLPPPTGYRGKYFWLHNNQKRCKKAMLHISRNKQHSFFTVFSLPHPPPFYPLPQPLPTGRGTRRRDTRPRAFVFVAVGGS